MNELAQVTIENPIINSPYGQPTQYFEFSADGITGEVIEGRRPSQYFIPVPRPRRRGAQLAFDSLWVEDRFEPNTFINRVRDRVDLWRRGGYQGITKTTRTLLEYWTRPDRHRRLFYCQVEALETAIYITEVAHRFNDAWIANAIREANEEMNPELYRIAFKMATGTGKTVVMSMLIAWQALNKIANRQDARFTDAFLVIAPGITIRDRLQVLYPNHADNYYRSLDLLPSNLISTLGQARIAIVNFHALLRREHIKAGRLTKEILTQGKDENPFQETPAQMVNRVTRSLGSKKNVIVINDEAHHCYRARQETPEGEKIAADERQEAKIRDEEARIWLNGIEAIKRKIGVKTVYDLSATPFYLKGSGYPEGKIFPWVVSDFSLIDAIEAGLVKVPRVPVADNTMAPDMPTYRNLWVQIRDDLPKRGRAQTKPEGSQPLIPAKLEGALYSLYEHYEKVHQLWLDDPSAVAAGQTPPVFIVVCNNTTVSKLVFDWIAGWEKPLNDDTSVLVPGNLALFSNITGDSWRPRPNTILVDSHQLESGEAMKPAFKKIAAREINDFKAEYRRRYPGRDPDAITDEDLLREVMNSVGKPGRLGEQVRCVVSVSMLTEGWDANTVTHIMGIRAFGTQLLCEQVIGRALRRISYTTNDDGHFDPEYAEVYGVPFSLFLPTAGGSKAPRPNRRPTHVRALPERSHLEITFPRLTGYRYDLPPQPLQADFNPTCHLALSTKDIPTETENAPIIGQSVIHSLEDLKARRLKEVDFLLAKLILEKYFRQDGQPRTDQLETHQFDAEVQVWRFPQLLPIVTHWRQSCLVCRDDTFPQLLLLIQFAHNAADRIYQGITRAETGEPILRPILQPHDTIGSTSYVDFDTVRPVFQTGPERCHVSHVAEDSGWEGQLAQKLETMDEVVCYVKNDGLNFKIPYTHNGRERNYVPDFIIHIDDGQGQDDLLKLVLEVSGEDRSDKAAKVAAATNFWIPAVNNHGGLGRWSFIEITDPTTAKQTILDFLATDQYRPLLVAIEESTN